MDILACKCLLTPIIIRNNFFTLVLALNPQNVHVNVCNTTIYFLIPI